MSAAGHDFTEHERDRALTALALCGGNSVRARELLEHDRTLPRVPSEQALRLWRNGPHAERYQEIRTRLAPEIEEAAKADYREIVIEAAHTVLKGVRQAGQGIDGLNATDAARVAKDVGITAGVAQDKLLLLEGRPNVIHGEQDVTQLVSKLTRELNLVVDSTATEIETPALIADIGDANPRETPAVSPSD